MRELTATETSARLPYPELAAEIGKALRAASGGDLRTLERGVLPLPGGGAFLTMAAADPDVAVVKVASVHPGNQALGLPTVRALVVVVDARDGTPVAILDGATVTTRRTAALSLLAAKSLGAVARNTLIVGAGVQAKGHLEAVAAGTDVERLQLYARRRDAAEALAEAGRAHGLECVLVEPTPLGLLGAAAEATLLITTTNSLSPVLPAEVAGVLRPEATLVAVGAFTPQMSELAPEVVGACDVVVDTLEGARGEAGDLIQAAQAGTFAWEGVTPLAAALGGFERRGRPVLFKSVGHSMFDLAAAKLALRVA